MFNIKDRFTLKLCLISIISDSLYMTKMSSMHECREMNCFHCKESDIMGNKEKYNEYRKELDIMNEMIKKNKRYTRLLKRKHLQQLQRATREKKQV